MIPRIELALAVLVGILIGWGYAGPGPATRARTNGESMTVNLPGGETMAFAWVGPGTFTMGSDDECDECTSQALAPEKKHRVTISRGFWLGKYEITQGQWEKTMSTRPWADQSNVVVDSGHPAVYVSWEDVQTFIHRLNQTAGDSLYRLPTEAE
jgi:formylglycine-generating enzyme required for sulfatase activity